MPTKYHLPEKTGIRCLETGLGRNPGTKSGQELDLGLLTEFLDPEISSLDPLSEEEDLLQ